MERLAVVVLVLVTVLVFVTIFVTVLIVVVLIAVLVVVIVVIVLITVFHFWNPPAFLFCGSAAQIVYPAAAYLSFGLKINAIRLANTTAAAMPPAVAFKPPVKIPNQPSVLMASFTPFARL